MITNQRTRALLTEHYGKYECAELRDIFKFIYQSSFGCEHLISSLDAVTENILREYESAAPAVTAEVEPLDGEYSRVPLSYLSLGLSAETLGKLFFMSAKKEQDGKELLETKLATVRELIEEKKLPFAISDFERESAEWRENGFCAVRHSSTFRESYHPSYRVVANKYVKFLPLLLTIDKALKSSTVTLAIDGGSASGKTTLGEILTSVYCCTVLHMDDFFLRPEQRTPERYAEIGGNVDRERFLSEVLQPLRRREPIDYKRFDCSTLTLLAPERIQPTRLTVIEGAYSMHPELAPYYDISVLLDVTAETQRKRISKRNSPKMAERFFSEWIPLEQKYFTATNVKKRCDLTLVIDDAM